MIASGWSELEAHELWSVNTAELSNSSLYVHRIALNHLWRCKFFPFAQRHIFRRKRRTRHKPTTPRLWLTVLSPSPDHIAPRQRETRLRPHLKTFKNIVIKNGMVVAGADRFGNFGITHDDVCIRALNQRALFGIDIEDFRDIGTGSGDKFTRGKTACLNALGPQNRKPFLQTIRPVWDQTEIIFAHQLLRTVKSRVVRRNNLQTARLQPGPQTGLMFFVTERWGHNTARRMHPITSKIFTFVQR